MEQHEFTQEKMEQLEEFLLSHMQQDGCMPLDVVHGYLAAVVSGPHLIMPDIWMPAILGEAQLEAGVENLLMELYNSTIAELESDNFEPMILSMEEGYERPLPLPYGWCEGYIMGWNVHGEDTLDAMAADKEAALSLGPVAAFLMYEEDQLLAPPNEEEHRIAADQLADSAVALYRWWFPRRNSSSGHA
jgi:uncharacterized protein